MSGNTITPENKTIAHEITTKVTTTARPAAGPREAPFTQSRAARELGLKRSEFDLAVDLGHIRTLPDEGGGGRRVARAEIQRLLDREDFPEALRKRVETVGTKDGAEILEITAARFTRLARLGLVVPVAFYLNRYRAVVWRYLADDLREFAAAAEHAELLSKPLPETLRDQLDARVDLRPRNWRGRRLGFLLRRAEGPWERAAAVASLLDRFQVSEIVTDPYERAHLNRFRPRTEAHGAPGSPAAHLTERITTAQDADEIDWLRAELARAVAEARAHRPAPRPAPRHGNRGAAGAPHPQRSSSTEAGRAAPGQRAGRCAHRPAQARAAHGPGRPHGLLGRIFRRGAAPR
ncbi:DUF6397 family protein [Streptomyces sp. PD-S100-1]|uniref:DUF6397 family protein n=1 Tax=Streptomyces sp. PD-S100-1 TaxID=3394351 RepID=UPI0039BD388A